MHARLYLNPLLTLVLAGLLFSAARPACAQDPKRFAEDAIVQELAVKYYAAKHRVEPERAKQRLEIQDRAAGIEDKLAALLGEQYAGIWYDADDEGRLKIGLTRDAAANAGEIWRIVDAFALAAETDLVEVRYSELELEHLRDAVRGEIADMVDSARASTGYDTRSNSVVVRALTHLSKREEALIRRLETTPGISVRRIDAPSLAGRLDACRITACNPPLRGGRRITGLGMCTAAFIAQQPNDPNLWVMTAGHCLYFNALFGGGYKWSARDESPSDHMIGFYVNYTFATSAGRDAGEIWVVPSEFWAAPAPIAAVVVKASDDTTYNPTYEIRATSRSSIGQTLCRTGGVTGSECGEVVLLGADESAHGPDGYMYVTHNMGEIDVCGADGGDSGGPIYKQHRAFGIYSGHVDVGPAFCWEFYQGIRDAEKVLNLKVLLAP